MLVRSFRPILRALIPSSQAVLGSLSSALAARFDYENLQKREPAFMALFAEATASVAELEGREEEGEALEEEMFHLIEGQQPIKSEHLIMDISKVGRLKELCVRFFC